MTWSDQTPGEQDVQAVEQRLAALYGDLAPAQQTVLATIVAAGLDRLTRADDTSGYSLYMPAPYETLKLELEHVWRQADRLGALGEPPTPERAGRGGVLQPLVEFFRRRPAAVSRAEPAGGAPA